MSYLNGLFMTIYVFVITLLISLPLSIVVSKIQYFSKSKILKKILFGYITVMRGTPLLLQLMFVYFGLPYLHITFSRMTAIFITFILNYLAYFIEIFRGAILGIDVKQTEVCKVLQMSKSQTFCKVLYPQAIRSALPSISNEILNLVKDTSLISVLGASELLKVGRNEVNVTASAFPFIVVGVIYLLMSVVISIILKKIERQVAYE